MIYDIVTTTTFKNGQTFTDESSIEAPSLIAAIVFEADGMYDSPYKPSPAGEDEGKITISAKAATNNVPAYQLQKAAVTLKDGERMITDWNPVY